MPVKANDIANVLANSTANGKVNSIANVIANGTTNGTNNDINTGLLIDIGNFTNKIGSIKANYIEYDYLYI